MEEPEDGAQCSVELKPMEKWLQEEEDGECRPCCIAVIIGDYQKVLEDNGHSELSEELASAVGGDGDDPILEVAKAMDRVKKLADKETRQKLLGLDCIAQENPSGRR